MKILYFLALLCLGHAAEEEKTSTEIPDRIQMLITNHINQVLQQVMNKSHQLNTLTGQVPQVQVQVQQQQQQQSQVGTPVVEPFSGLLPPIAHTGSDHTITNDKPKVAHTLQSGPQSLQNDDPQVRVINHVATATLSQHGKPVVQNKVVMTPVSQIVVESPGRESINIADKLHQLQHHVNYVMQQAQTHIPQALQQAIREKKKKQQEQQEKEKEKENEKENEKEKEKENEQEQDAEKDRTSTSISTSPSSTSTTSIPTTTTTTTPTTLPSLRPRSNQKTARSIGIPSHFSNNIHQQVNAHNIPQLLEKHRHEMNLGKCNFDCPREALTICATNGKCVVNFPGQCELSQWNCFNTKNVFHQVHDSECQNTITCYQLDMLL